MAKPSVEWTCLSIPKLQRPHRLSLGMDKLFHPTQHNGYNYLSMVGFKFNHVCTMASELSEQWRGHSPYMRPFRNNPQDMAGFGPFRALAIYMQCDVEITLPILSSVLTIDMSKFAREGVFVSSNFELFLPLSWNATCNTSIVMATL